MKRKVTAKLRLKKETLGNLSDQSLKGVAGGFTTMCSANCEPTGPSYCIACGNTTGCSLLCAPTGPSYCIECG